MSAAGLNIPVDGQLIGSELLVSLKQQGFSVIRIDCQRDGVDTAACAQEVLDAGLQPLVIIRRAEQMKNMPEGPLYELGNEPNYEHNGWTLRSYIEEGDRAVSVALDLELKLYLGAASNFTTDGLKWISRLPSEWWDAVGCSMHWYPHGDNPPPKAYHPGFLSRGGEVQRFRDIVGSCYCAITEVGYNNSSYTEDQVAANMRWEAWWWTERGFELVCGYNINDGPPESTNVEDRYGWRAYETAAEWKPVVAAFTEAMRDAARR
jgi:hypothetical protein